ncbi:MAG TPA: TolC family protein [Aequorivita sp.]|nr:TolC family protein [Aequorivita sp.]
MKALLFMFFTFVPLLLSAQQVLTLEECYGLAERNYPLARQTDLLEERSKSEVNIINKEKLPQLNLNAQATYQSDVIQFPIQMPGVTVEPPNNDQYRASLDVNQLIYHGGSIEANTNLKKAELQTQQQQVVVNLYSLRTIINQNYFSVLLFQEQAKQQISKKEQLQARLNEIDSGVKYGAVLPSTSQLLQAEILKLEQQLSETEHNRKSALDKLASLLSKNLDSDTFLAKPEILIITDNVSNRPELKLFEMQQNQLQTSKEVISKTNYPRLSGFAQAGFGNPGLNMLDNSFQDFYMAGLKLNWNILDWGKAKERKQAVDISQEIVSTEKETFVLNNNIQLDEAKNNINKYEEMLQKDTEIINLRQQVLEATTSQFQNGAIRSSEYITELNNLYEARITKELHSTQLSLAKANYKVIKGD